MSTNYYWKEDDTKPCVVKLVHGAEIPVSIDPDDPRLHIGKRSAAGRWCHDCNRTLCKGGVQAIHHTFIDWRDDCPECHATFADVGHACSFSWAASRDEVMKILAANQNKAIIVDEYDRDMTGLEMVDVLAEIKIHDYQSVGKRFC